MFSKNQPCLQSLQQRYVNKGDTWWIQVVLHQGHHWGDSQMHNQSISCTGTSTSISWKGAFQCQLSSKSWKWCKNDWNCFSNEWRALDRSRNWTTIPRFGKSLSFLCWIVPIITNALWHWWLGHCPMQTIRDTISQGIGNTALLAWQLPCNPLSPIKLVVSTIGY